jgi:hypothetical protein
VTELCLVLRAVLTIEKALNSSVKNNTICGQILVTITTGAPVAQGIERRTPDPISAIFLSP